MIRAAALTFAAISLLIIGYRIGWECATRFGHPALLLEAAELRIKYYLEQLQ